MIRPFLFVPVTAVLSKGIREDHFEKLAYVVDFGGDVRDE